MSIYTTHTIHDNMVSLWLTITIMHHSSFFYFLPTWVVCSQAVANTASVIVTMQTWGEKKSFDRLTELMKYASWFSVVCISCQETWILSKPYVLWKHFMSCSRLKPKFKHLFFFFFSVKYFVFLLLSDYLIFKQTPSSQLWPLRRKWISFWSHLHMCRFKVAGSLYCPEALKLTAIICIEHWIYKRSSNYVLIILHYQQSEDKAFHVFSCMLINKCIFGCRAEYILYTVYCPCEKLSIKTFGNCDHDTDVCT